MLQSDREERRVTVTLSEFLAIPSGMSIEEWDKELKRQKRVDNKIRRISDRIFECDDALEVLADEKGSDRWNRWNTEREQLINQREQLIKKDENIRRRYK